MHVNTQSNFISSVLQNYHNSWSLSACHYTVSCFDSPRVQSCFDSVYDRYLDTVVLISPFLSPLVTSPTGCCGLTLQGLTSPHSQQQACRVNTRRAHTLGEGHSTSALQETSGMVSHILSGMGSDMVPSCSSKLIPSREVPVPVLRMWFSAKMWYGQLPRDARLTGRVRREKEVDTRLLWAKRKLQSDLRPLRVPFLDTVLRRKMNQSSQQVPQIDKSLC